MSDCKLEAFYKKHAEMYAIWAWVTAFRLNGFDNMTIEGIIDNYINKTGSSTKPNTLKTWYYNLDELHKDLLKNE